MEQIRVCTYDGPGARPVIRTVPWPKIGKKAALIKVGACGVCGTDLHILKGHWPKPLPWPFTLGHEIGGVLVEVGSEFNEDFMSKPLKAGSKVMIPPLMPCGHCYYCIHYPQSANKCLTPVYYGRYLGFEKAPHLWGGWAEYVYVDLEMLPGTKIYKLPDDMPLRFQLGRHSCHPGLRPDRDSRGRRGARNGSRAGDLRRRAGRTASGAGAEVRRRGDRRYRRYQDPGRTDQARA
jgi:D-arabinose 1-dehydrogenase-like Zn-dependent alcohol dehydrogenase